MVDSFFIMKNLLCHNSMRVFKTFRVNSISLMVAFVNKLTSLSSKFELELITCHVLTYHSEVHTQFWMSVVMKHQSNEEQKRWRTGKYTEEQ